MCPQVKRDSQSSMSDALAGDVSLDLSLVDSIDADPHKSPTNGYSPKSVSPRRFGVKADETQNKK